MIIHGDSLEILKTLEPNSVDAVVTDPPYGLSFMGKKWDYDVPSVDLWKEVFRVAKPGAHILSFGGTRTYHRMVCNIEDAGFEVRDQIQWIYGSGFPKSMDVSKAIDKAAGAEREVIGQAINSYPDSGRMDMHRKGGGKIFDEGEGLNQNTITSPATPDAIKWQGFGTALKPANEPIVLARKPLSEKTVAKNVLKHGTGALNIDGSRIGTAADMNANDFDDSKRTSPKFSGKFNNGEVGEYRNRIGQVPNGRWPANVLFGCDCGDDVANEALRFYADKNNWKRSLESKWADTLKENDCAMFNAGGGRARKALAFEHSPDCAVRMLDEQSGVLASGGPRTPTGKPPGGEMYDLGHKLSGTNHFAGRAQGGASRFFYVAKASKRERNAGLEGMPEKATHRNGAGIGEGLDPNAPSNDKNFHPTVKPIKLMEYLCKLICHPNGVILDPFMGSGSTGVAAKRLGFEFIGIEKELEYCEIAKRRVENVEASNTAPVGG